MGRYNGSGPSCGYFWVWIFFLLLSVISLGWCYKEKVRGGVGGGGSKYGGGVNGGFHGGQREDGMSNKVGEPSCDELRAMWRYHRRQSRAELTNQIPAFEPPFWDLPSAAATVPLSSFGTLRNFKSQRGRSKGSRHGGLGYRDPAYGHLNFFGPSTPRQLRPMEQLIKSMPKLPPASAVDEPTVHYSPPPTQSPPTPSSLQQLQQMYLEHQRAAEGFSPQQSGSDFGTVVLSPPTGQDGRIANKPKALMTPFEKIRFGHADFQGIVPETITKRGLFYYPIRTSRLRPSSSDHHPHQQQSRHSNNIPSVTSTNTGLVPTYPSLPQTPLPSVFSFWGQRQLLPQEPPPSTNMCSCQGKGLYRCFLGQCHFLSLYNAVEDEEPSQGTWHTGPIIHQNQLGLWEQEQQQEEEEAVGVEDEDDQDQVEEIEVEE